MTSVVENVRQPRFRLRRNKGESKDDFYIASSTSSLNKTDVLPERNVTRDDSDLNLPRKNSLLRFRNPPKGRPEKMKPERETTRNSSLTSDRPRRRRRRPRKSQDDSSLLSNRNGEQAVFERGRSAQDDSSLLTNNTAESAAGTRNRSKNPFSFRRGRTSSDPGEFLTRETKAAKKKTVDARTRQCKSDDDTPNSSDWITMFRDRFARKRRSLDDEGQSENDTDTNSKKKGPRGVSWNNNFSSDYDGSEISAAAEFPRQRILSEDSASSIPRPILKIPKSGQRNRYYPSSLLSSNTKASRDDGSSEGDNSDWSFSSEDGGITQKTLEAATSVDSFASSNMFPVGAAGRRARYSVYHGNSKVKKKLRVRPYHRFPEGRYMTEEEIYGDSLKPSQTVVDLKSYLKPTSKSVRNAPILPEVEMLYGSPKADGRIGALRAEVLGCVALARSKPDIAVYMVCGDTAFCTDVITGYRSPMWPCETRRAAVFPLHHAYIQFYVGVFDVRVRKNKENDVFCGRVALDVASLRPDTEYDVTLPLRASTFVYDRRQRGVIRLRFSLHWFSERAAVLSYFKPAKSIARSSPFVEGQPTIPCADPKTFRNVAVTVYGQDLPGKYSRTAFKSTMREFNLYQQNVQLVLRHAALDAILYQKTYISLYLFAAGIYCCTTGSVYLVPPFFVGYLLIRFVENYNFYVKDTEYNFGYKPLTLLEVFNALWEKPEEPECSFKPALIEKKTKRHKYESYSNDNDGDDGEILNLDHREFPFSERDAYPKLSVEDALSPSQSSKGGATRLHGRLSVYYSAAPQTQGEGGSGTGEDDSSEDNVDEDEDMTVTGMGDELFNLDENEEEELDQGVPFAYRDQSQDSLVQSSTASRRIRLGPPQDVETRGRKIPPQVQLQKAERILHKFSMKVSVEMVSAPSGLQDLESTHQLNDFDSHDSSSTQAEALQQKKTVYDEFDKLLGHQMRTANPVTRIMSSFLGPLMRMLRVAIYLFRIMFHVTTWRDPFLSFWVLAFLSFLCILLIIFPWKKLFSLLTIVLLGPQNIILRQHLEKKARERTDNDDSSESTSGDDDAKVHQPQRKLSEDIGDAPAPSAQTEQSRRYWRFGSKEKQSRSRSNDSIPPPDISEDRMMEDETAAETRPAFKSELRGQSTSSRRVAPRAVAIPYSRVKKDRFFDWPPDPHVSRATPMPFLGTPPVDSASCELKGTAGTEKGSPPHGLRRRNVGGQAEGHQRDNPALPRFI